MEKKSQTELFVEQCKTDLGEEFENVKNTQKFRETVLAFQALDLFDGVETVEGMRKAALELIALCDAFEKVIIH